jgi:holin-like protein
MVGACGWLLLFQLAGEVTVRWLQLPLPGPVVGMVLLFAALAVRGDVPDQLRATGDTLIRYLTLLVVPATAGLVGELGRLGDQWLAIMVAAVGGAALTMTATALTLRLLLALGGRRSR